MDNLLALGLLLAGGGASRARGGGWALPDTPPLLRGYCPCCDALVAAVELAEGVPAAPLACAPCGAALHPPLIATRRAPPRWD